MTIQEDMAAQAAHEKIVAALTAGWPGAQWSLFGSDPANLTWLDTAIPQPTTDQINAAVAALPSQQSVLSQDLMAQFTSDDAAKIQAAVAGSVQFWLLWSAMQAQRDPMIVTNARFLAGWAALVQVLGQPRMIEIALALGVTV